MQLGPCYWIYLNFRIDTHNRSDDDISIIIIKVIIS